MRLFYLCSFCLGVMLLLSCNEEGRRSKKGFVPAGALQVAYQSEGKGSPVLLIHAGLQNSGMWAEQVTALSNNHQVITIDLPYHGATTGQDTSIAASEVVKLVLDHLGVKKTAIAGLSMGAAVAQDFMVAYPERVTRAILLSSGLNGYEKEHAIDSVSMSWYPRFAAALERGDTARAALEFAKAWGEGVNASGDSLRKPASRWVYKTTLATLQRHRLLGWPKLQDHPTAYEDISKMNMPILLVHGDEDLPFIAVASKYIEQKVPGAKRIKLKGAAHMLNMEKPGEVNRIMQEFLD